MSARPVRALGLDLSLVSTGMSCPVHGVSVLSFKLDGPRRLVAIRDVVLEHALCADLAAIEGYSFGSHAAQSRAIGELGGVVRVALFEADYSYAEVPPKSLKKYVTDKGNAGKDEMLSATIRRWPEFTGTTNNESDAYGLMRMAHARYNHEPVPAFQQKVLDSVEWPDLRVAS
jgi:Holliday junction resolvasome RuvABC endonuclease subunit